MKFIVGIDATHFALGRYNRVFAGMLRAGKPAARFAELPPNYRRPTPSA